MTSTLSDKTVLITGANHGIGAATARTLAARGARVLASYLRVQDASDPAIPDRYRRNRASNADHVVTAIKKAGGDAVAVEADLADAGSAAMLFDAAESNFGPVDIIVNNATGWVADSFVSEPRHQLGMAATRVSPETFDQQFAVDARGAAMLISEFARRHAERRATWGRIIGLTSGGPTGFPGEVSYGAAKAALENYTMSAAFELARLGITANVVYPPVTDTGWVTDKVREHVRQHPQLIHIAEPDDVAAVIAYLASDDARLITGNVIHLR